MWPSRPGTRRDDTRGPGLLGGGEFGFQALGVQERDFARLDGDEALHLESGQVSRHEFTHGADMCGQFVMTGRKRDDCAALRRSPVGRRLPEQPRDQLLIVPS